MAKRLDPLARAAFWGKEIQIDGRDTEAGIGLSQALRTLGNFDEALEAAQRVLVIDPRNLDALLEVARSQIGRGQGFYAIEPGRQAQALAPHDWRPLTLLAVAYELADRSDEAAAAHKQALALAPENPAVMTNYALFLAGHGESAQAESLLRAAAAKPGADIAVRQNLALLLGLQGRLDEAEHLARQDLPPTVVENNLAYLRNASAPGQVRSWDTVRQGQ
ncbi:MAG: pilus assembly protein TadD [Phenylobacterium zucineum]|nr:MAG: pilus assembly protein TadD [Phenylobacterium zucineum]